jgi:hypothetical protein
VKAWYLLVLTAWLWAGCASQPGQTHTMPAAKSDAWSTVWTPLLNGRDLSHWTVTDFVAHGAVTVESNKVTLAAGAILTGINWTGGPLPKTDYEISLDALRSNGSDFFCGLTFPVADSFCSLILGGWGGSITGLSSLDDLDASENETSKTLFYEIGRWYHVRLRVTPAKIEAWLDQDKIIDANIAGRKVSLRPGPIEFSAPLGLAAYQTGAAVKNVQLHRVQP